ncbi:hypothetical protein TTHERM_01046860 (macronuclear) [Tetrahymena thermophila SB210]|uniref:Uncharacterized protein n=1 Tax=Tetrahymena thermophila (strain SB210) TaxID=312017 RepID=Q23ML1_TETTS|nr:hypothetical protein TTHERM_01046860 [Tetrahymena thermophila SB210]EAR97755.1 hypothetical protein TTHERM_01046860 [Tetrahymena thermophila SB210]|eukprot:XP_001018000.1 hypothetical protein TTHERM_01046860 [Tetrahymena thermophila SB210]
MNQNPLKDFEQKFENFIRLWVRYFYHVDQYVLAIEILIDSKKAMLQYDYLVKGRLQNKENEFNRKRLEVLEDLYSVFILNKQEIKSTLPEPDANKGDQEKKETQKQRDKRLDESIVWGFDFDNLDKYEYYITQMKQSCEADKVKLENEIDKLESNMDADIQKQEARKNDISRIKKFTDLTLKIIEDSLKHVLEAAKKTDIKKSAYHTNNYNLQSSQEMDESKFFTVADQKLKCKQYARLHSYCIENSLFHQSEKELPKEETQIIQQETIIEHTPEKKKKQKK